MKQYHDQLRTILDEGVDTSDRTGVGTRSYFGMQARYPMKDGFPLVTTKKLHLRSIIHELIWFLNGDTNIKYLNDNGVKIWDEWADENGDLGDVYGKQWRDWPSFEEQGGGLFTRNGLDQIAKVVEQIRNTPDSRRLIVSAWNPAEIETMALPPCHTMWQVKILGGKLHLHLYQRSGDMFLGVPFNIACYSMLLHMLANVTGYQPGDFVHTMGDAHIYSNHMDQVNLQLSRELRPLPTFRLARDADRLEDFRYEDFIIEGYDPHPHIKGEVAV